MLWCAMLYHARLETLQEQYLLGSKASRPKPRCCNYKSPKLCEIIIIISMRFSRGLWGSGFEFVKLIWLKRRRVRPRHVQTNLLSLYRVEVAPQQPVRQYPKLFASAYNQVKTVWEPSHQKNLFQNTAGMQRCRSAYASFSSRGADVP